MLKFIKNLFSRKKTENSQPIETIESAIKKSTWTSPGVTGKVTSNEIKSQSYKKPQKETRSYRRPASESKSIYSTTTQENNSDFLTSMMIANATDSALMGTLIGGDPLGAMVGDMMNDSDSHSSHSSYSNDSYSNDSSSNDSNYSNDSYSSDSYSNDSFSSDSFSSDSFSSDF